MRDTAETAAPHLRLEGLEKRYGDGPPAVAALSLTLGKGQMLGLLGPSGCGKTTTLRMIGGLIEATSGRVVVDGRDVTELPPHRRDMGIVFQNYALFPHMTVAENLAFGLEMRRVPRAQIRERVQAALDMVRLGTLGARRPRQLSGGQQQRVALARALVIEPSILLLDEPLSNLDASLREEMRGEIRDIQQRLGITAVFVTHDQAEALAICDHIAVMRTGNLEQFGSPEEIYEHPANAFVAEFVGRINRIRATRDADGTLHVGAATLATRVPGPPGPVQIMLRPHRLRLGAVTEPGWTTVTGSIHRTVFVGDVLICEVAVAAEGDAPMILNVERHTEGAMSVPQRGEPASVSWREADMMVFAGTGAAA